MKRAVEVCCASSKDDREKTRAWRAHLLSRKLTGILKYAEWLMTRERSLTRDQAVERAVLVLTGRTTIPVELMSPAQRAAAEAAKKTKTDAKTESLSMPTEILPECRPRKLLAKRLEALCRPLPL